MRGAWIFAAVVAVIGLMGCRGCIEQHDPRSQWKKFSEESSNANRTPLALGEKGDLPNPAQVDAVAENTNPIDEKYQNFCAGCHGKDGKGDGAAGASLNPKPRNFTTWNDATFNDDHIELVIKEGGVAVGKSAAMAAWGGVLGEEGVKAMVQKVKSFRK